MDMPSHAVRERIPYFVGSLVCLAALVLGYFGQAERVPLPACGFLRLTGYPCACCGATRSFFQTAKGEAITAAQEAPLGVAVYAAVLVTLAGCLAGSIQPAWGRRWGERICSRAVICGAIGIVLANWVYRLAMGLK